LAKVYLELNGGSARILDFQDEQKSVTVTTARARPRPAPLDSLITDEECAAHEKFVEEKLGDNAIWKRYS